MGGGELRWEGVSRRCGVSQRRPPVLPGCLACFLRARSLAVQRACKSWRLQSKGASAHRLPELAPHEHTCTPASPALHPHSHPSPPLSSTPTPSTHPQLQLQELAAAQGVAAGAVHPAGAPRSGAAQAGAGRRRQAGWAGQHAEGPARRSLPTPHTPALPTTTPRPPPAYLPQNHFPERLGKAVNYKPPTLFNLAWRAISPFVDPHTRDKLVFLSPSTKPGARPCAAAEVAACRLLVSQG